MCPPLPASLLHSLCTSAQQTNDLFSCWCEHRNKTHTVCPCDSSTLIGSGNRFSTRARNWNFVGLRFGNYFSSFKLFIFFLLLSVRRRYGLNFIYAQTMYECVWVFDWLILCQQQPSPQQHIELALHRLQKHQLQQLPLTPEPKIWGQNEIRLRQRRRRAIGMCLVFIGQKLQDIQVQNHSTYFGVLAQSTYKANVICTLYTSDNEQRY